MGCRLWVHTSPTGLKRLSSSRSNKEVAKQEYSGTYVFAVLLVLGAEDHPGPGGFPGGSVIKNPPANAGDMGLIPGLGRSPREEMATHCSILA